MAIPQFVNPLTNWWTFGLFSVLFCFGCYEYSCYEHLLPSLCVTMFSFLLGKNLGFELVSHVANNIFNFTWNCFPKWIWYFTFSPALYDSFSCSMSMSALAFISHFNLDHSGRHVGLPRWLSAKESTCQCRRCGFNPWVRKIPGVGNGNPLQYACLENSMGRGAWWVTVHGVAKSQTQLSE